MTVAKAFSTMPFATISAPHVDEGVKQVARDDAPSVQVWPA